MQSRGLHLVLIFQMSNPIKLYCFMVCVAIGPGLLHLLPHTVQHVITADHMPLLDC